MTSKYPGVRILPSGTIAYFIREPDHAGVVHQRTITRDPETGSAFASEYQASRARARHQARIDAGQRPRSRDTLAMYATAWLATLHSVKPTTVRTYTYAVDHITRHIGSIAVADLRPSDVRALHEALAACLSPKTASLIHSVLGTLLDAALDDGIITTNPARRVKGPSGPAREIRPWEPEQARAFLVRSDQHPFAAFWRIALETGMRTGELRALAWGDVDFRQGYIFVRRTVTRTTSGRQVIGDSPKSESSRRAVPMSELVVKQLRTRKDTATSTLVFPSRTGQLIGSRTIRSWFLALCVAASVPPIRLHDLRHTAATLMLLQGIPVHVVAGILGHASPAITHNVYAHATPASARDAIDLIAEVLSSSL